MNVSEIYTVLSYLVVTVIGYNVVVNVRLFLSAFAQGGTKSPIVVINLQRHRNLIKNRCELLLSLFLH